MTGSSRFIIVNNIKLPVNASVEEAFSVAKSRLSRIGITVSYRHLSIYRRSIDARRRDNILFVYSVAAFGQFGAISRERLASADMSLVEITDGLSPEIGAERLSYPPVIVGSGPAGIFAALLLAERGYRPIVIERGGSGKDRQAAVRRLSEERILDGETNIQFGAGGAGTFSDGKLVTRINDRLTSYVIERFIEFGADESIRYIAKPHVGTDVLSGIVERMLDRILELGGRVEYNTKFLRPKSSHGQVVAAVTSRGEIPTDALILAIGHSARDTYEELLREQMNILPKDFSVGMRIEHLAQDIDRSLYGSFEGHPALGHAEYNLSYDTKNRGVYTFCMCPGGEVVAAASESGGVVVNGMSYNDRGGKNSNSAVVCSIFRSDYGNTPRAAIEFQRKIERAAFVAAGSDFSAPIVTVGDFLRGECRTEPGRITPTYMDGQGVRLVSPDEYLPEIVTASIRNALPAFDKRIAGFAASDAVLTGPETRTSSPIRMVRDNDTRLATGYANLYPIGEGAGYAGGITSAAVDGIKTALTIIQKYAPI